MITLESDKCDTLHVIVRVANADSRFMNQEFCVGFRLSLHFEFDTLSISIDIAIS